MGRTLEALLVLGKEAHVALAQSTQQEEAEGLKFQCVGGRGCFPVQVGREVEGNSFSYQKRSRFHLTDGTSGEGRSFLHLRRGMRIREEESFCVQAAGRGSEATGFQGAGGRGGHRPDR